MRLRYSWSDVFLLAAKCLSNRHISPQYAEHQLQSLIHPLQSSLEGRKKNISSKEILEHRAPHPCYQVPPATRDGLTVNLI